ncbi:MAG: DinB family protein, partial [Bacteroidia bacterium]
MKTTQQLAKHLRDIHFGGNWTSSNFKDLLSDMSLADAEREVNSLNSIALLVCHSTYYVGVLLQVLEGKPLNAKDESSFILPQLNSQKDWDELLVRICEHAERAAGLLEQLPDTILEEPFTDEKYGTWYRNIAGIIEHLHYHLGQIALIKKML